MGWERATGVAAVAVEGLLPPRAATPLTWLLVVVFAILLVPVQGLPGLVVAMLFARLMTLDLTTYTLPNIYTMPMLAVGFVHAFGHGLLTQALLMALLLVLFAWLLSRLNWGNAGVGGGDLKLLAAMFAFVPLPAALCALALGSLLWLPVAFVQPKRAVPLGVPVLLGWLIFLRVEDLPNRLFSTIS